MLSDVTDQVCGSGRAFWPRLLGIATFGKQTIKEGSQWRS
jgi:hypothetical protein